MLDGSRGRERREATEIQPVQPQNILILIYAKSLNQKTKGEGRRVARRRVHENTGGSAGGNTRRRIARIDR